METCKGEETQTESYHPGEEGSRWGDIAHQRDALKASVSLRTMPTLRPRRLEPLCVTSKNHPVHSNPNTIQNSNPSQQKISAHSTANTKPREDSRAAKLRTKVRHQLQLLNANDSLRRSETTSRHSGLHRVNTFEELMICYDVISTQGAALQPQSWLDRDFIPILNDRSRVLAARLDDNSIMAANHAQDCSKYPISQCPTHNATPGNRHTHRLRLRGSFRNRNWNQNRNRNQNRNGNLRLGRWATETKPHSQDFSGGETTSYLTSRKPSLQKQRMKWKLPQHQVNTQIPLTELGLGLGRNSWVPAVHRELSETGFKTGQAASSRPKLKIVALEAAVTFPQTLTTTTSLSAPTLLKLMRARPQVPFKF